MIAGVEVLGTVTVAVEAAVFFVVVAVAVVVYTVYRSCTAPSD